MIECMKLSKRYGGLTALDDLTLSIGTGEVFGFIGPNGAGKTTTMKILSCLLRPDSGTAKVCGLDVATHGDEIRRLIGYMPDFLGYYDDLTVDEYLQFFAAAFGIARSERRRLVGQVLELTDLTQKREAMVEGLSRGMQQRLGVARVLIHDPKVLLLDEPASGLDPRARIEMRSLLTELARMGKTLMVSSHILTELGEMSSSIGIIERGRLLYAGTLSDALARSRNEKEGTEEVTVQLARHSLPPSQLASLLRHDSRIEKISANDEGYLLTAEVKTDPLERSSPGQHHLLTLLMKYGAVIEAFRPTEMKLEDAFLKLTTGALQ